MRSLSLGVLLAPYRVDYYNLLHDKYGFDIYFQLKGFEGQMFSNTTVTEQSTYRPKYLQIKRISRDRQLVFGIGNIIKNTQPYTILVPEFSILTIEVILFKILHGYKYKIVSQCDESYSMIDGKGFSVLHKLSRVLCLPYIDDLVLLDKRASDWYQQKYKKGHWLPLIQDERKVTDNYRDSLKKIAYSTRINYNLNGLKIILFVGRLIDVKNLPVLFDACTKLITPYKLIVVGDGVRRKDWENICKIKKINAEFVGQRNGDELNAWYYSADVFVLPSILEPFGAVVNEALLYGCPCCVSSQAGSSCLIEEGINGYLVNPYSSEDIANKIGLSFKLPYDFDRKSKMLYTFSERMDNVFSRL